MSDIAEREVKSVSGIPFLCLLLGIAAVLIIGFITGALPGFGRVFAPIIGIPVLVFLASGLYKVEPNQSAVLSLFGKYVGTVRANGLRFNNPFYTKKKSL